MNKKRLSAVAGVLFVLLIFLQLQTFAANQSLKLISSVSESKDNVVRTYTYNSNGLLGSHKYQQIGWNTFTYNYKYNELGELIWERDGDTKNTLTFVYDDDGRVLKKIKNDDTSGATVVSWFGNTCASYGKVQYTSNAAGQILTSSSYAHLFVNNKEYGDTEVYTFTYDGNGNICESKWEFPDLQTRYYTFAMTYQDGVVTKASDSTHDYQYTIEYTLVSVPEEFVNLVKAQQKILLHTLNYSAPIVMREFQFASAGNLVKQEEITPTLPTTATPTTTNTTSTTGGTSVSTPTSSKPTTTVKKANPMTVKAKTVKISAKTLRKKNVSVAAKKAFTVKKAKGKVTFKKTAGSKKIIISKAGKITVKKGLKKGKYPIKVKITAAGNKTYKAKSKTVKLTITVK